MENNLIFKKYNNAESEELARWIAGEVWPYHGSENPDIEKVRKWISNGKFSGENNLTFWIYCDIHSEPIGIVCLQELDDITPIFDLRLKAEFRRKGLGRKILNWLVDYVFTQTDKHRLEGHTRADNIGMQRVFKACGWVLEAYYRLAWPDSHGNYHDAVAYAILKKDWETGQITSINWLNES